MPNKTGLFLNLSRFVHTPYIGTIQMVIEDINEVSRLACLEVRGGNDRVAYAADLPGLAGWVFCRPLRPSPHGGDLYYLSACSHGVTARVVVADVSGHGDQVGAAALRLRDALRHHVDHWDQSMLIRHLNDNFLLSARHSQFATAFLASYYAESGELLFTNAGHMPPLWYRTATGEWSYLQESTPMSKEIVDLPLGMIAGTSYSQTAVQLDPGDLLLLYTDGISEATDESGEQLGLDRLLSIAENLPVDSAVAAGKGLVAAAAQYRGRVLPADDQTVIALQRPKHGARR
jgi:serine phosphatase RsbU (regulator of sigma subunit)